MKLIEADKVEQAIKDYWKAQVDRMPTPYSTEEFEKFANRMAMCFEHRDELLKEIKALPSAQPERLTDDDFETIRIHLNAYKEKLCNQQRWEEAEEYQRIIDRFMAFASAQSEPEAVFEWKKEFKEYIESLDITRDDWKGIIEYIDELPSAEPYTTTHDSIPAKTGENDGDRTTDDYISRQQAVDAADRADYTGLAVEDVKKVTDEVVKELKQLPSVQPLHNITMTDVLKYIDDMPEDVWLEFTCCLECRGWELQRRTAKWCGGDFA